MPDRKHTKRPSVKGGRKKEMRPGETRRWIIGFTLLFLSLFVLLAVVSYYFTWNVDQAILLEGLKWSDVQSAANGGGVLGAFVGSCLVGSWFGAFALRIPVLLIILSLRIMRYRPVFLEHSVRLTVIVMILGSLSLGCLFDIRWGIFGTGLGGTMGIAVARWGVSLIGRFGLLLMLILGWVLVAVYINRRTIAVVNRMGDAVTRGAESVSQKIKDSVRAKAEARRTAVPYDNVQETLPEPEPEPEPDYPEDEADVRPEDDSAPEDGVPVCPWDERENRVEEPETAGADESEPAGGPVYTEDGFEFIGGVPLHESPDAEKEIETGAPTGVVLGAGGVVVSRGEDGIEVLLTEKKDAEASEEDLESDLYDPTRELADYKRPPVELLENHKVGVRITDEEIADNKRLIRDKLADFGIQISPLIKVTIGPTITLYEIEPAQGVKISRIRSLEEDIALALKVQSIRIVTRAQGRGTIGIEVPNSSREVVSMYSVVRSAKFQDCRYQLPLVLGRTIHNETFIIDLAKMPHLLIAGATGQGKSVGLNAIITSLLYKKHPAELKFVLVDPKQVELSLYAKLEKHFLAKMESEDSAILTDTQRVVYTLNSLCMEMQQRYQLLNKAEVRGIADYNDKFLHRRLNPKKGHRFLPYIVVVVDEFADMIMTAGKEVEIPITRLAQLARAVGIHLVIATQRPDVKVITGLIKANFPARIAFRVTSMVDSRTILDQPGANQLIGQGDMLMLLNGDLTRLQCAFVDTPEIERLTSFIGKQRGYTTAYMLPDYEPDDSGAHSSLQDPGQLDSMFAEVARFVVQNQQGSTSSIQRRFSIGYNRAGRLMDQLEGAGIVGRAEGSKPREVMIMDAVSLERILTGMGM